MADSSTPPAANQTSGAARRALVMDDDALVRSALVRLLKKRGFEIDQAPDGDQAIALFESARAQARAHQVVFVDLTIPGGRGGAEVLVALRRIDAGVPVVVMSGYSADESLAAGGAVTFSAALPKPFTGQNLDEVLARVLAAR